MERHEKNIRDIFPQKSLEIEKNIDEDMNRTFYYIKVWSFGSDQSLKLRKLGYFYNITSARDGKLFINILVE